MVRSKVIRVSNELSEEIEKVMRKNQLGNVEASREIAFMLRNFHGRKIREITF